MLLINVICISEAGIWTAKPNHQDSGGRECLEQLLLRFSPYISCSRIHKPKFTPRATSKTPINSLMRHDHCHLWQHKDEEGDTSIITWQLLDNIKPTSALLSWLLLGGCQRSGEPTKCWSINNKSIVICEVERPGKQRLPVSALLHNCTGMQHPHLCHPQHFFTSHQ